MFRLHRKPPLNEEELGEAKIFKVRNGIVGECIELQDVIKVSELLPKLKEVPMKGELESGIKLPGKVKEGLVVETEDRRFVIDTGITVASRRKNILLSALGVIVIGSIGIGVKLARMPPSYKEVVEVASQVEHTSGAEREKLESKRNRMLQSIFPERAISVEEADESYEYFKKHHFNDKDVVFLMSRGWTKEKLEATLSGAAAYSRESGIDFTPVSLAMESNGTIAVFIPSYPITMMCFYLGDKESIKILPEHSASVAEHEINHFLDYVYHNALTRKGSDRNLLFQNAKKKLLEGNPTVRRDFEEVEHTVGTNELNDFLEEVRVDACGRHVDGKILLYRYIIDDLEKTGAEKISTSLKRIGMLAVYGTLAERVGDKPTAERFRELADGVFDVNPEHRVFYESFSRVCDAQYDESYEHRDEYLMAGKRWQQEAERRTKQHEDLKDKRRGQTHERSPKPEDPFRSTPRYHRRR